MKRKFSSSSTGASKKSKFQMKPQYKPKSNLTLFQTKASPELKNHDVGGAVNPGYDVSNLVCVNPIAAGTSGVTMTGRRAVQKSLLFRYNITNSPIVVASFANAAPQSIRCILVYDRSPDGTIPAVTDLLTSNTVLAPLQLTNADRWLVLHDEVHEVGVSAYITGGITYNMGGFPTATKYIYKKLSLPFVGPSTAGIIGIQEGAIYFYAVSNLLDANTNASVNYYSRVRFQDN